MSTNNLLTRLNAALPELSKSEIKVANAILTDPEAATRSSIAVLAAAAGVSEPSVNRFTQCAIDKKSTSFVVSG